MRKLCIIIAVAGMACAALAEPHSREIAIPLGTATSSTQTLANVVGHLIEIQVSVSDNTSTGNVYLAYVPIDGVTAAVNVATNVVTASAIFRPAVDSTDILGAALTNDPPHRYALAGESLRMIVSGSPTNLTGIATVKFDK